MNIPSKVFLTFVLLFHRKTLESEFGNKSMVCKDV